MLLLLLLLFVVGLQFVVAVDGVDVDVGIMVCGTKCGVRLDIGGNIGLVGH